MTETLFENILSIAASLACLGAFGLLLAMAIHLLDGRTRR